MRTACRHIDVPEHPSMCHSLFFRYVYTITATLFNGSTPTDSVNISVGMRTIGWAADSGMQLNGEPYVFFHPRFSRSHKAVGSHRLHNFCSSAGTRFGVSATTTTLAVLEWPCQTE